MEDVIWDELSESRRKSIAEKASNLAAKYLVMKPVRNSLKVMGFFAISRALHKNTLQNEEIPSADNQHWIDNGWIKNNSSS